MLEAVCEGTATAFALLCAQVVSLSVKLTGVDFVLDSAVWVSECLIQYVLSPRGRSLQLVVYSYVDLQATSNQAVLLT